MIPLFKLIKNKLKKSHRNDFFNFQHKLDQVYPLFTTTLSNDEKVDLPDYNLVRADHE